MSFFRRAADLVRLPLGSAGSEGLRGAQIAASHAVAAHFWASTRPALVVMPTGSGKTDVMILASILLRATRVLVVAPSRLLCNQLAERFASLDLLRRVQALELAVAAPKVVENKTRLSTLEEWNAFESADVVITTPHAASPGIEGVPNPPPDLFDVVVFDEGHHMPARTFQALSDALPAARQVLFTATPFRRDEREIVGDIVFTYDLARARRDGVFGKLRFVPVDTPAATPAESDAAIARAAEAQLRADREAGFAHALVVRAASRARAGELLTVYEGATALRLQQVHSGLTQRSVNKAIAALRAGELDGVITVDMLGEGFDLPNLKVAALHAPHRSLGVTLQFIGRFARTSAEARVGEATFFAVPREIEGEAASLYVPGAEWNELVENLSRDQVAVEGETRRLIRTFAPQDSGTGDAEEPAPPDEPYDDDAAWALLRTVRPYFHVKVYEVLGDVDLDARLAVPRGIEPILVRRSSEHHALVWVGEETTRSPWSVHEPWSDVRHELFIVVHVPEARLLFICASRRDNVIYDALVESVAGDSYRRLAPNEINRVLRDVSAPEFFSVGMRNRASMGGGGAESYRMLAGRAADRAIRAADGAMYDQGHGFCRGVEGEDVVTIGFSSGSKVWANRHGPLIELFEWVRTLAAKLTSDSVFRTGSGMDQLAAARRATKIEAQIVAADLPVEAYQRESSRIRMGTEQAWLVDFTVAVESQTATMAQFILRGGSIAARFNIDLQRAPLIAASDDAAASTMVTDEQGRREGSFSEYLNEHPPVFYLANLATLRGEQVHDPPSREDPAPISNQIEGHDWEALGVDPFREKPPGASGKRSLFEFVEQHLLASDAGVIFFDDAANEIADLVAIRDQGNRIYVQLFHCKAAGGGFVPNDRIEDVYEVVGQAVKCRRWLDARRLATQIEHREAHTQGSRLIRGTLAEMRQLLMTPARVAFEVVIVQPAIRTTPKETIAALLTAADAYMRGGDQLPLRIWATRE